jgi:hypothetical protein
MIAKIINKGRDENNFPVLDINFIEDCFVKSNVEKTDNGYIAEVEFELKNIMSGDGDVYFNVYRLETDGGEMEKYLFAYFIMCHLTLVGCRAKGLNSVFFNVYHNVTSVVFIVAPLTLLVNIKILFSKKLLTFYTDVL